jgi:outer membrane protein
MNVGRWRRAMAVAWLGLGAGGALVFGAAAEEPLRLTEQEAVQRALSASPRLAGALAQVEAAGAEARVARAARLPQIDLGGGYTRYSNVPELSIPQPSGPPRTIFPNLPDNYRARLAAGIALYSGGRTGALVEAAEDERDASTRDQTTERLEVELETRAAYWSLVTARELARLLAEAVAAYEAHLKDAENRAALGMAAQNEVLAVKVERERGELARLRAENAAAVGEANLARLLGLSPEVRLEPAQPLEGVVEAAGAPEDLVAIAFENRPERAALVSRLGAAEARVRVERAARLPQVAASGGYDYANPNRRLMPPEATWKESWDVGLNLSLSLFDGGKTSAATARARARSAALRAQLEDLTRRIRLQVTQRTLELEAARAAVAVAERGLEAARENQRVAGDRYREGLIASSELLDAEVALLRAGVDRTEALAQLRLAAAGLARALGR